VCVCVCVCVCVYVCVSIHAFLCAHLYVCVPVCAYVYFCMVRASLLEAILILFCASRCVMPSVLRPSIDVMMSPWTRLPPAALLPGVI
jgi:hypothetical protein